jgi:hypothetical protein
MLSFDALLTIRVKAIYNKSRYRFFLFQGKVLEAGILPLTYILSPAGRG